MRLKVKIGDFAKTISEWSRISGTRPKTIRCRLHKGMEPVEAVFRPTHDVYDVYDRDTDQILVAGLPIQIEAEMLGVAPNTLRFYLSRPCAGKYKVYNSEITGEEIYLELLEEGKIK